MPQHAAQWLAWGAPETVEARRRFGTARLARAVWQVPTDATDATDPLVPPLPVVYLPDGDLAWLAVTGTDEPGSLPRGIAHTLAQLPAGTAVGLLVDRYDEGHWDASWWLRIQGHVISPEPAAGARADQLLQERYGARSHTGPVSGVVPVQLVQVQSWLPGPVIDAQ